MWSFSLLLVLVAQLFAHVTAQRDLWLLTLPQCWQDCFADTDDGCSSSSCICKTSESSASTYLPSAVSCAVDKCGAEEYALKLALGPLQLLCYGLGCPISKNVMDEAYAASESDAESSQSTPAPKPTTSKKADHTTSQVLSKAPELTSIIRSTLTQTTTDSSGNTLQIIVPIVVGPSGIATGSAATSTLTGRASSTRSTSPAPSGPAAEPSLPDLSLLPSSTATSAPQRTGTGTSSGGNGSPFDSAGAASRWSISLPLLGLGALAILFMRI